MKAIVATLLAGGSLVAAEMPSPDTNECGIVSVEIQRGDATLIDPTPPAESLRLVVYCGHAVMTSTGAVRTERALKILDIDIDDAVVIVEAAGDLLDEDVFRPDN